MTSGAKRLGLIVNPVAGLGGRVGLKGSDGLRVQKQAIALGAIPRAMDRAAEALMQLRRVDDLEIVTWSGRMGEDTVRACDLSPVVVGSAGPDLIAAAGNSADNGVTHDGNAEGTMAYDSTADDTRAAAGSMRDLGVDLLLFAGGDGTARDICLSIGEDLPALGIPAGVKIHSAVYARNPLNAGELAALFLEGHVSTLRAAEVMDIDEEAARDGRISAQLHGYLRIPSRTSLVQSLKAPSGPGEEASMDAIAAAITESMEPDTLYLMGPGTTIRAILARLGLRKTLIGVDAVENGKLVAEDLNETQILSLIEGRQAKVVVTPIGGQGCIFGRGNQQLSPEVLARVGRNDIIVVATPAKTNSLGDGSLWVDTGDREVDATLAGHLRVVTGYKEEAVCRVSS